MIDPKQLDAWIKRGKTKCALQATVRPVYRCARCDRELENPVEGTSFYIWNENENSTRLICPACVKPDDTYIWGLENEEGAPL